MAEERYMAPSEISQRIFICLENFNFRMTSKVIADWELDQQQKTIDQLRAFLITTLIQAYQKLVQDPESDQVIYMDKRLVVSAFRNEIREIHFQVDFVLVQGYSEKMK